MRISAATNTSPVRASGRHPPRRRQWSLRRERPTSPKTMMMSTLNGTMPAAPTTTPSSWTPFGYTSGLTQLSVPVWSRPHASSLQSKPLPYPPELSTGPAHQRKRPTACPQRPRLELERREGHPRLRRAGYSSSDGVPASRSATRHVDCGCRLRWHGTERKSSQVGGAQNIFVPGGAIRRHPIPRWIRGPGPGHAIAGPRPNPDR